MFRKDPVKQAEKARQLLAKSEKRIAKRMFNYLIDRIHSRSNRGYNNFAIYDRWFAEDKKPLRVTQGVMDLVKLRLEQEGFVVGTCEADNRTFSVTIRWGELASKEYENEYEED